MEPKKKSQTIPKPEIRIFRSKDKDQIEASSLKAAADGYEYSDCAVAPNGMVLVVYRRVKGFESRKYSSFVD